MIAPIVLVFAALPSLGPNRDGLRAPFSPIDDMPTPYFQGPLPQQPVRGCTDFGIYTNNRINLYEQPQEKSYFGNKSNKLNEQRKNQLTKSSSKKTQVANNPSFYPYERAYLQSIIDRFDLDIDLDSDIDNPQDKPK